MPIYNTAPYIDAFLKAEDKEAARQAINAQVEDKVQSLGQLAAQTLPSSNTVDLSLGNIAVGHLIANTVLTLTGAQAGQSGLIALGNDTGHDGVGYTVSFHTGQTLIHADSGHTVMTGDLADFATAPSAGEFNYGTIGWFYDGNEYLLYVSEVLPFTDVLTLPS